MSRRRRRTIVKLPVPVKLTDLVPLLSDLSARYPDAMVEGDGGELVVTTAQPSGALEVGAPPGP